MPELKKCIIWDLDNTLWDGICLEGNVTLRPGIPKTISILDQRGILHSIASRGEEEVAMKVLRDLQLSHFFVAPKINWLPKTTNIINIARGLNISLDSIAFVDDDQFELDQVTFMLPDVKAISSDKAEQLPDMPIFNPGFKTIESKSRRQFYQADEIRKKAEQSLSSREEFLNSCNIQLSVRQMNRADIPRVSELMTRTHQLNTTGQLFDKKELLGFIQKTKNGHTVFVAELKDKFGWSGIIGTAVIRISGPQWRLMFFAMSCRVLGRGIERAFLAILVKLAFERGCNEIEALYKHTGKNRMMRAFYQMSGFSHQCDLPDSTMIFKLLKDQKPGIPNWVKCYENFTS